MRPAFPPLDEELQLLPGNLSPNLAEGMTRLGLWMPFAPAREVLFSLTGARVSEATARRETLAGEKRCWRWKRRPLICWRLKRQLLPPLFGGYR